MIFVSVSALGLPAAIAAHLPKAKQQRCITHKVRRLKDYLSYAQLPEHNEQGQALKPSEAKQQRRYQIQSDAYDIYKAKDKADAQKRIAAFRKKAKPHDRHVVQTLNQHLY